MKHTNRLSQESSPYLLQHAHNPVDWFPWGEEAFEKAKAEDKPILVSIGYSTCHWCHVMERESFENEDIAAYMNQHFINIKVDREERPDIDSIYMEAIQMITGGHGGWPLNCFLLPDGRPFFGGTYFPPRQAHGRASWGMVLQNIQKAYNDRRHEVLAQAEKLMQYIGDSDTYFLSESLQNGEQASFKQSDIQAAFQQLVQNFDSESGGFGYAPKFPSTMALQFCLKYYYHTNEAVAMNHLQLSLDAMIYGGIYDQLAGGFARYATDKHWLVPHFEKMLYDNALLVGLLADAYKLTGKALYKETIEETIAWLETEMLSPEGAFYAALDADSEGVEGKFYVWSKEEIIQILGTDAPLFCAFYDVSEGGNWEHVNILNRPQSFAGFAQKQGMEESALKQKMAACRQKLLELRNKRIRPGLDDKILLAWNAMMISGICQAYQALGHQKYLDLAQHCMDFLLQHCRDAEGRILHDYKNGKAKQPGFLDDYAVMIEALLNLYQCTFNKKYLLLANDYTERVLTYFSDKTDGLFFYTPEGQKDIVFRKKDLYDNALPSGNSTMMHNLLQLSILLEKPDYKDHALQAMQAMHQSILKFPQTFARWADALFAWVYAPKELAIVGPDFRKQAALLQKQYLPSVLYCAAAEADAELPLLRDRSSGEQTLIFVCSNYTCQLPVKTVEEALTLV